MLKTMRHAAKSIPGVATTYRTLRDWRLSRAAPVRHPSGFLFVGPKGMQSGAFEAIETQYLIEHQAEWECLVNVGAYCGYYTCLARSLDKHVVAVEPHPRNCAVLLRNLDLNGWADVEIFPVALSDHPGLLRLYGSGTGASLIPGWAQSSKTACRLVPVSTLDRIIGRSLTGKRILYWIDVEGAEYDVLLGGFEQLQREPAPLWVIEISVTAHQPRGVNPRLLQTFELFWNLGYRSYRMNGAEEVTAAEVTAWQDAVGDIGGENFMFRKD